MSSNLDNVIDVLQETIEEGTLEVIVDAIVKIDHLTMKLEEWRILTKQSILMGDKRRVSAGAIKMNFSPQK